MKSDLRANPSGLPVVDTHAHVFSSHLALAQARRYTPAYEATLAHFLRQLDAHAIGHAVLVQPSFLGTDNRHLLQALAMEPRRLRGVAVLATDAADEAFDSLGDQGITGVRLNLVGQPASMGAHRLSVFGKRLAKLGWHVELHREAAHLAALIAPLVDAGVRVVVDHFGRPDPHLGIGDPGFRRLLEFAQSGLVWVKLSAAYRCVVPGTFEPGHAFARHATEQLLNRFGPGRLMWGSDWPHTQFEKVSHYGNTLETLMALGLDDSTLAAISRTTPNDFYRFHCADTHSSPTLQEQHS